MARAITDLVLARSVGRAIDNAQEVLADVLAKAQFWALASEVEGLERAATLADEPDAGWL